MDRSRRMIFGRFDYAAFLSFFVYAAGSVIVPVALVSLAEELGVLLLALMVAGLGEGPAGLAGAFYLVPGCFLALALLVAADGLGRSPTERP